MFHAIATLVVMCAIAEPYEWAVPAPDGLPAYRESMVCPENAPNPYSHAPTLAELADGALICAWEAGAGAGKDGLAIVTAVCESGGKWGKPTPAV